MRNKLLNSLVLLTSIFIVVCVFQPSLAQAKTQTVKKKVAVTKSVKKPTYYRMSVSQIPGADEKSFSDTSSRCLTSSMKALHQQTVKQMEADIAKRGTGHEAAVQTYRDKIDIVWSAMEQPYCGFGSQGMTAVKHSYNKSVVRIRDAFLAATK